MCVHPFVSLFDPETPRRNATSKRKLGLEMAVQADAWIKKKSLFTVYWLLTFEFFFSCKAVASGLCCNKMLLASHKMSVVQKKLAGP